MAVVCCRYSLFPSHWWPRQCVCTPQVRSVHRRHQGYVCYIPCSRISRLETNHTASRSSTRVGSNDDVNICSDGTSAFVHSDSVAPQSTSVRLFGDTQLSTLQHFVLELRAVTLYTSTAFRSTAGRSGLQSQGSRTSSWWSCLLSMLSSRVAPSSKSCLRTRFFRFPQLQSDAQSTPLSRGVCTSAAPQEQRKKDGQRTATQT